MNLNFAEVRELQESLRKSLKEAQVYKCSTRRRSRLIKAAFTYRRGAAVLKQQDGGRTPQKPSATLCKSPGNEKMVQGGKRIRDEGFQLSDLRHLSAHPRLKSTDGNSLPSMGSKLRPEPHRA